MNKRLTSIEYHIQVADQILHSQDKEPRAAYHYQNQHIFPEIMTNTIIIN
jgi:hypothetical protein